MNSVPQPSATPLATQTWNTGAARRPASTSRCHRTCALTRSSGQKLLEPGETFEIPGGGSITFEGLKEYVTVSVNRDPGRIPALIAAILAVLGVATSFMVRRRRVWVRASAAEGGRTVVEVGGLTLGNPTAEFDEIVAALRGPGDEPESGGSEGEGPEAERPEAEGSEDGPENGGPQDDGSESNGSGNGGPADDGSGEHGPDADRESGPATESKE